VQGVMTCNGLEPLCIALTLQDAKMLVVSLDAIERVLEVGEKFSLDYNMTLDEFNGIDLIEVLQEHPNDDVYKKAIHILENYFSSEDDGEDENLAPAMTDNGNFAFGVTSKQLFPGQDAQGQAPMFNFSPAASNPPVFGSQASNYGSPFSMTQV
jgi:hypothetical protein